MADANAGASRHTHACPDCGKEYACARQICFDALHRMCYVCEGRAGLTDRTVATGSWWVGLDRGEFVAAVATHCRRMNAGRPPGARRKVGVFE